MAELTLLLYEEEELKERDGEGGGRREQVTPGHLSPVGVPFRTYDKYL